MAKGRATPSTSEVNSRRALSSENKKTLKLIDNIWKIGDTIRGTYKPSQYGKILLPLTVLRRLDCVLAPTKNEVLEKKKKLKRKQKETIEVVLNKLSKYGFHNSSPFDFSKLKNDPDNIRENLGAYIRGFSSKIKDVFGHFDFETHTRKLNDDDLLYKVICKFEEIDLSPDEVTNREMGIIFEEVIRQSSEESNEEAGDHFTPRDVVKLATNLVFASDCDLLSKKGVIRTVADFTVGTGGFLSQAHAYLKNFNPDAELELYGQDINAEAYAVCCADMLIHGQNIKNIVHGCSLKEDGFKNKKFNYILANPPFGVDWKNQKDFVKREHEDLGSDGRFEAGLPPVSDSSLLFLQHMISKCKINSKIGIILPASALFRGKVGSGESNIRKWIIESDWLETIVALPTQLFYGTSIQTFIWILSLNKKSEKKGKIQLIDASSLFEKMPKSLGNKRNVIPEDKINEITKMYSEYKKSEFSKIIENDKFCKEEKKKKGTVTGYEINFQKYFQKEIKTRSIDEIVVDISKTKKEIDEGFEILFQDSNEA